MSQDPRKIPKESSFLQPKQAKIPPSDDPTSPREMKRARTSQEQRESPQDSSFLSPKEKEKHIISQGPYAASCSSVSPMNRDEEAFKRSTGKIGSQKYLEPVQMMPTPGNVNSSKNNKNNSGQSYLGVEAFINSVDVRAGMQQQLSNSSVIGVHSGTWFANPEEYFQQANDKLQHLGMAGEGYGTSNPDLFVSGGNIASMISQRDTLRPEMQQKMSNVSNNSMGGGVGMHAKSIDSGDGYTNNPVAWYNMSNSSVSGNVGMNANSVDSGSSFTTSTRNVQHAYYNYQLSRMQGEEYTNNPMAGYNMSNSSISGSVGMNAKSVDSGSSFTTTTTNLQHAYDNYQLSRMQSEEYTNNPVAGYNVSNNSICGSVGMNAKSVDSCSSSTTTTSNPQHAHDNHQHLGMQGKDKEKIYMIPTPTSVKAPSWTITKKLIKSDVRANRLYLPQASTLSHIRKHLSVADSKNVDRCKPVTVAVYDYDMATKHKLDLVYGWDNRYALTGGWQKDFLKRRSLNEGDEIGLFWDKSAYRLQFGVISRANAKAPAEEKKLVIR